MGRTTRTVAAIGAALAITTAIAGCAQPGQLGRPATTTVTVTAEPPVAAEEQDAAPAPELPLLLGSGLLDTPIEVETPGPAVYSVRTVIIPAGVDVGWHLHPGTETAIVTAGEVTVQQEDACEPVSYGEGQVLFVPDAVPHVMRNDGDVTAELVVTYLFAPGAPDQVTAPDACADEG